MIYMVQFCLDDRIFYTTQFHNFSRFGMINSTNKIMKNWIINRISERTTWDGAALVALGVIVLIAKPIAGLVAYAAIGYGAWTIWKSE